MLEEVNNLHDSFLPLENNYKLLDNYQHLRLMYILVNAISNVPAYRNLKYLKSELVDNSFLALRKFPVVEKKKILKRYSDYISSHYNGDFCYSTKTSGSTGVPFVTIKDDFAYIQSLADTIKIFHHYNIARGSRILRIAGRIEGFQIEPSVPADLYTLALVGINSSSTNFNIEILKQIIKFSPEIISGHSSEILLLHRLLEKNGLLKDFNNVQYVFSGGELLHVPTKKYLEQALHAKVIDSYGLQEIGDIAYQCDKYPEYYHIHDNSVYLEVIDSEGNQVMPGNRGEFVATSLNNITMPFIRYRTGDYGVISASPCKCGKSSGIIQILEGRSMQPILLAGGDLLNPYILKRKFEDLKVSQYQVVQNEPGKIIINIVLGQFTVKENVYTFVKALNNETNDGTVFSVKFCEISDIISENGKVKPFISNIEVS
ncbi:hypothetical protein ABR775_14610 [Bacillus cereus]|uniref:phenylacetate--CoA ligase family protein n=1 Tax=Bacillus cereus TaxID=1396 RepID=UPI003558AEA9|nr:phenylacetate--CoA ligase family protein [Bacillus cereus]